MGVSHAVASRYAKSLIELATEKNALDNVKNDFAGLIKIIEENRDFELMLSSPIIGHDKKLSILNAVFKSSVHELTSAFFKLITTKNREEDLAGIAKEFIAQYNEHKGVREVDVTTTIPLTDSLRKEVQDIVKKATGKEALINEKIDENLIAGYILRMEDRQIDASVKTQLQKVKNQLNKK